MHSRKLQRILLGSLSILAVIALWIYLTGPGKVKPMILPPSTGMS